MTAPAESGSAESPLGVLHLRLEQHYAVLAEARRARHLDASVFALEHGLSPPELLLLESEVRAAIGRGRLEPEAWLPLVVYATEIGYSYSGDEYWQTFEAKTPGWAQLDQRAFIRDRFKEFSRRFSGAVPSGPWAEHFSIISWPITHAILPTDLQRQLARVLYEYRRGLTSEQLAAPEDLGRNLAARAWFASKRFQQFAENTSLLGLVAASLLGQSGEPTSRLAQPTFTRLVKDLSSERQAKDWLNDARSAADRVRARGLGPTHDHPREVSASCDRAQLSAAVDPLMFLRRERDGWATYLEMPDFSVLTDRLPTITEELLSRRVKVAGVAGAPLARGRLLHPGQVVRLSAWPSPAEPLVQLEGGSDASNSILADQSVMTPEPWLFRAREDGLAREVRGKFVRPGARYILLSHRYEPEPAQPWVERADCLTEGVHALALAVPERLDSGDLDVLRHFGAGTVTEIEVRPAGLVPAYWDGEGRAEWLLAEEPVLGVFSERAVEQCIITTDGVPALVCWPADTSELFVKVNDLTAGKHQIEVSLRLEGERDTTAQGRLELVMRPPHVRPPAGTMREGLMILATPVAPTLPEIWDETATVELRGPIEASVELRLDLADREGRTLSSKSMSVQLPVDGRDWRQLFNQKIRDSFSSSYDRADQVSVIASHPSLGSVALTAQRPLIPLRWILRRNNDELAILELIDNSGAETVALQRRSFDHPDTVTSIWLTNGRVELPEGGLVTAIAGEHRAAIIVPKPVRTFADMGLSVNLVRRTRSLDSVLQLVAASHEWWIAPRPANAVVVSWHQKIREEFARSLTTIIAGDRWAAVEREMSPGRWSPFFDAMGRAAHHRDLASRILNDTVKLEQDDVRGAVSVLADALKDTVSSSGLGGRQVELADLVLRLVTNPGSLPATMEADELRRRLNLVLDTPVLLKAARLLSLIVANESSTGALEWVWQ